MIESPRGKANLVLANQTFRLDLSKVVSPFLVQENRDLTTVKYTSFSTITARKENDDISRAKRFPQLSDKTL